MVKKINKVILDTNILLSAIVFGGKPQQILLMVLEADIQAVTSPILIAELIDVLSKKFSLTSLDISLIEEEFKVIFKVIQPRKRINILKDNPDNRVLEAAVDGHCDYIITGDKELLRLGLFRGIKILTVSEYLKKPANHSFQKKIN